MIIEEISKDEYYNSVYDLVKDNLGYTYANNVKSLTEEDSVLLIANKNENIAGFACGYNINNETDYINNYRIDNEINSVLEKIVVHPDYRGLGIGKQLTKEKLKLLNGHTIVECWVRSDSPDSSLIYESLDFELINTLENNWLEESKNAKDENFCPDCGEICYCDSKIYVKK